MYIPGRGYFLSQEKSSYTYQKQKSTRNKQQQEPFHVCEYGEEQDEEKQACTTQKDKEKLLEKERANLAVVIKDAGAE